MTEIAREALLGDPGTVNIEAYRRDQTSSLSDLRVQGTDLARYRHHFQAIRTGTVVASAVTSARADAGEVT
jgi:hypothetical protein